MERETRRRLRRIEMMFGPSDSYLGVLLVPSTFCRVGLIKQFVELAAHSQRSFTQYYSVIILVVFDIIIR